MLARTYRQGLVRTFQRDAQRSYEHEVGARKERSAACPRIIASDFSATCRSHSDRLTIDRGGATLELARSPRDTKDMTTVMLSDPGLEGEPLKQLRTVEAFWSVSCSTGRHTRIPIICIVPEALPCFCAADFSHNIREQLFKALVIVIRRTCRP